MLTLSVDQVLGLEVAQPLGPRACEAGPSPTLLMSKHMGIQFFETPYGGKSATTSG
jgi:hypothetical protein